MESRYQDDIQTAGPIFELVQLLNLYPDSKRFPDSQPSRPLPEIEARVHECLEEWASKQAADRAPEGGTTSPLLASAVETARGIHELASRLRRVIDACFEPPATARGTDLPRERTMEDHIELMWDRLTLPPVTSRPGSTLLPIRYPHVVPGGRYVEVYYWDTYFTSLGLLTSGRLELLGAMVAVLADLIAQYGFVPNGTRTYYLSRSQPPFFAFLLRLLARARGEEAARVYSPVLAREHVFWHTGGRVVPVGDGATDVLNRYWDDRPEPRPEGFREDRTVWHEARDAGIRDDEVGVYRDLRAAAESGWDFSTRWLKPDLFGRWKLARIRTTSILPVDLNSLLYAMEDQLAGWLDGQDAEEFHARAERRRALLRRPPFWNPETGWFHDATFDRGNLAATPVESLAGVYPLFCRLADEDQAARVAQRIERDYLKSGGVVTTPEAFHSGQQWDFPNGWPPLQWVTVVGLCHYGYLDLGRAIAERFVQHAEAVFRRTGAMMEKFNVCDPGQLGGGGEYPNQEGFGWTNGVVSALLAFLRGGGIPD